MITPRTADEPVIAEVAEDDVVAVTRRAGRPERGVRRPFVGGEVEQEARDLGERIVLVVSRKLFGGGIEVQHIAGIVGRIVERRERFGAGHGVVAHPAMEEVAAQSAIDDVIRRRQHRIEVGIGIELERRQVDRLLECAADIDDGPGIGTRRDDHPVEIGRGKGVDAEEVLAEGARIAAGEDASVVAEHAVDAAAAGDPVMADSTDQIVVLTLAEHDVVAAHAVERIVARLAVDFVARAVVQGGGSRVHIRAAGRVVEKLDGARYDMSRGAVIVVIEGQEGALAHPVGADQSVDVAVVAEDGIGVVGVALRAGIAR